VSIQADVARQAMLEQYSNGVSAILIV